MSDFTPIPEPGTPSYPEHVKMIMPGEFAAGGPGSPENTQAEALTQRTQWLKAKIAEVESAIPGSGEWQNMLNEIRAELDRLQSLEVGALAWQVDHLERIITSIMLEVETKGMFPDADAIMVETFDDPSQIDRTQVKVTNAFSGDDSIDVEDLSGIVVGANYVLSDGNNQESIRVKSTATSGSQKRVMAENSITGEYDLSKTFIYRSSVSIHDGEAHAGGRTSFSAWAPGEVWKGEVVAGGDAESSAELTSASAPGFESTPAVAWTESCVRLARIFGIAATGAKSSNGVGLDWIDESGNIITLDQEDFDEHPAFNLTAAAVGDNHFRRIPIAYWKRGSGPSGSDTDGKWCMWISDVPAPGFAANPAVFKKGGAWLDRFLWGTYRAHNNSGVPGSQPGKTHWGNVSWQTFKDAAASLGNGHHMVSLFEWHEILGRAAIEKKTIQLVPAANRQNAALCKYRGIEEFAYHGPAVYVEWMDGIRTDSSGKYEIWLDADGSYTNTGVAAATYTEGNLDTYFNQGLRSGGAFDFLFIAATMGKESTSFIPDLSGRRSDRYGRICYSNFHAGSAGSGAFNSNFYHLPSDAHANIGSRLAKW